jgi:hypothetical protein
MAGRRSKLRATLAREPGWTRTAPSCAEVALRLVWAPGAAQLGPPLPAGVSEAVREWAATAAAADDDDDDSNGGGGGGGGGGGEIATPPPAPAAAVGASGGGDDDDDDVESVDGGSGAEWVEALAAWENAEAALEAEAAAAEAEAAGSTGCAATASNAAPVGKARSEGTPARASTRAPKRSRLGRP